MTFVKIFKSRWKYNVINYSEFNINKISIIYLSLKNRELTFRMYCNDY